MRFKKWPNKNRQQTDDSETIWIGVVVGERKKRTEIIGKSIKEPNEEIGPVALAPLGATDESAVHSALIRQRSINNLNGLNRDPVWTSPISNGVLTTAGLLRRHHSS